MLAKWIVPALSIGFITALFLYEADVMWFEEGFVFGALFVLGLGCSWYARRSSLHPLYLRNNPGVGLVRLAFWASMAWCVFTLVFFGDPTIVNIWYAFYLAMAYGVIQLFGLKGAETFGVRLRVDVYERKNFAAAIFIAAFMLSTGLIFGGSMWGALTPESLEYGGIFEVMPSYEDGWWITPWFFIMAWVLLFLTMKLWFYREKEVSGKGIRRDRSVADAQAAGLYCLGCAIPLTDAVAGDYYGMADSLIGFAAIALPVVVHEAVRPAADATHRDPQEGWLYLAFGLAAIPSSMILSTLLGFR